MICPYCQHELSVADTSCPRCHTEFAARAGGSFGLLVRKIVVAGVALVFTTIMVVMLVLPDLPGGRHSLWGHGTSSQAQITAPPDFRSPDLNRLLAIWGKNQQNSAFQPPTMHDK